MFFIADLDQRVVLNMVAALEYVCRKLPPDRDTPAFRKSIADEIAKSAKAGETSLADLRNAGLVVLNNTLRPPKDYWLKKLFYRSRR
jgi:hypothetical protein